MRGARGHAGRRYTSRVPALAPCDFPAECALRRRRAKYLHLTALTCTCLKLYLHFTRTHPRAGSMHKLGSQLESRGVVTDTREPDILRAAPVPLYNSYADVHAFAERLDAALSELATSAMTSANSSEKKRPRE